MVMVSKRCPLDVNLYDYISVKELAGMMDIDEKSAEELMNGKIEFEEDEIKSLLKVLGIAAAISC
jgi:plasmid maintenance system antidote protein VapI